MDQVGIHWNNKIIAKFDRKALFHHLDKNDYLSFMKEFIIELRFNL